MQKFLKIYRDMIEKLLRENSPDKLSYQNYLSDMRVIPKIWPTETKSKEEKDKYESSTKTILAVSGHLKILNYIAPA